MPRTAVTPMQASTAPVAAALQVPRLDPGITITARAGCTDSHLLVLGDGHFLLGDKPRALVLALLAADGNATRLEQAYAHESGQALPAARLIALAHQSLPAVLFAGAPAAPRVLPFTVSTTVLPTRLAASLAQPLVWLFQPRLAAALMALFALMQTLVLPQAMRDVHLAWSPSQWLWLTALLLASGLLHELGHIAACRAFGCPHGAIGFGLYLVFPAWYADVSKTWRLPARQRAVVDLGGVYLQALLLIGVDAWALASGEPLARKLVWLITFTMLFTLNPVFKFDGYWLLSDLGGLHNLHQQVRSALARWLGRLLGRKLAALPSPPRRGLLPAYVLLSLGYFGYFAMFLLREAQGMAAVLPARLAQQAQALGLALQGNDPMAMLEAATQIAAQCLWPAVVLSAIAFLAHRLRRAVVQTAAELRASRAPA